jgi:hypothetical protein
LPGIGVRSIWATDVGPDMGDLLRK